jgi:hypothetical protein
MYMAMLKLVCDVKTYLMLLLKYVIYALIKQWAVRFFQFLICDKIIGTRREILIFFQDVAIRPNMIIKFSVTFLN